MSVADIVVGPRLALHASDIASRSFREAVVRMVRTEYEKEGIDSDRFPFDMGLRAPQQDRSIRSVTVQFQLQDASLVGRFPSGRYLRAAFHAWDDEKEQACVVRAAALILKRVACLDHTVLPAGADPILHAFDVDLLTTRVLLQADLKSTYSISNYDLDPAAAYLATDTGRTSAQASFISHLGQAQRLRTWVKGDRLGTQWFDLGDSHVLVTHHADHNATLHLQAQLPDTFVIGCVGVKVHRLIDHPVFADPRIRILSAHDRGRRVDLRISNSCVFGGQI